MYGDVLVGIFSITVSHMHALTTICAHRDIRFRRTPHAFNYSEEAPMSMHTCI